MRQNSNSTGYNIPGWNMAPIFVDACRYTYERQIIVCASIVLAATINLYYNRRLYHAHHILRRKDAGFKMSSMICNKLS